MSKMVDRPIHYKVFTFDLSTSRTNEKIDYAGDTVSVLSLDGSATIRVNDINANEIDLTKVRNIQSPFDRFFITNTAQSGKTLIFAIGGGFYVESLSGTLTGLALESGGNLATIAKVALIAKGSIFNTAKNANTDFFATALSPTNTPCIFHIYVCVADGNVLVVKRTKATVTVTETLNSGVALSANCGYIFDIPVDSDETINLQYSTANSTVLKCSVTEISGAI